MRTEWLKYFLDVAKTGSLRASADNLYITQPALGAAISSLEKELGYPLFIRSHSGMRLTPYGEKTIPHVQAILNSLESCNEIKTQFTHSVEKDVIGSLNIVTVPTIGTGIMPTMIARFAQKFPSIELTIIESNSAAGMEQVINGEYDIGFLVIATGHELSYDDFIAELLWEENLYAFMRKDNILAKKQSVSLKTLQKYPIAIMSYEKDDFSVDDSLFAPYGGAANIVFRSNNHRLLQNYVLNSDCIGLTHFAHTNKEEANHLFSSAISFIPISNCPTSKFIAFYNKNNPKLSLIEIIIEFLRKTVLQGS